MVVVAGALGVAALLVTATGIVGSPDFLCRSCRQSF